MNSKFTYIIIIFVLLICLISSSVAVYFYYFQDKNININGTWLSAGAESTKNTLIFKDTGASTLEFKDTSNLLIVLPRQMNVKTRTPTKLDAEYVGALGDTIKFSTSDGRIGIYSSQASEKSPIIQYVYQKL